MKTLIRLTCALGLLAAAAPAWSYSCSLSADPSSVSLTYDEVTGHPTGATGEIDLVCNRGFFEIVPNAWIGVAQDGSGLTATRPAGGSLPFFVYHNTGPQGLWTSTGGVAPNSTSTGAVTDQLFAFLQLTIRKSYNFHVRLPGSGPRPAGTYTGTVPFTLRETNSGGSVRATLSLNVTIEVPKACRFSTAPTAVAITYPAFSPVAVTGRSDFAVTCTQGTSYELFLDTTRSVIPNVQLAYSLALNALGGTGTASSQAYRINVSVDPGQAGRCSGSTCTGQDYRTLTIRY